MEQLDLQDLLARCYDICDALMRADVGRVRSEGKQLRSLFRDDMALFGAYITGADGVVTDEEAEYIRDKLGFAPDAQTLADIRRRRGVAAGRSAEIPQSLKYAVLADAGKKLSPDPFDRQCAMYFYDTFKAFGQEMLARYAREVPQDEVQRFTDYLERMERMLNEYAVWRPVSQKSYIVKEPAPNQQTEEERAEELEELLAELDSLIGLGAVKRQVNTMVNLIKVQQMREEMGLKPADIARAAIEHAAKNKENLVILDTAGRLQIDEDMMKELQDVKKAVEVHQTILVVDAMTGQEAVNVAKTFDEKVGVDGVILSKMDGDTRGGAALSIKAVTGKPILYVGMGEKLSDLEQFYPDRMAGRILGMGDVLTLIDKAQQALDKQDEQDSRDMVAHLKKGKFDFNDYLNSLKQMRKMGGLASVLGMMPGLGINKDQIEGAIDEKQLKRTEAIVLSMTPEERMNPKLLTPQRKYRIAKGSGNDIADVNRFIKQFNQMSKMMKQVGGGKKGKRRRNNNPFGGMGGFGGLGGFGGRGGFPF